MDAEQCCEAGNFNDGHECRKQPGDRVEFLALPRAGVPDALGTAYSEEALKQMAAQAARGIPVLDKAGVQIGGVVRAKVDKGEIRVVSQIDLHYICTIPREQLVDPRCVVVSDSLDKMPPIEGKEEEKAE